MFLAHNALPRNNRRMKNISNREIARMLYETAAYLEMKDVAFKPRAYEKVADVSDEFAPYKAALSDAVRITLRNGLWGLGIKAPEKM